MDAQFDQLRRLLWRGGAYGNYYLLPSRRAIWMAVDDDAPSLHRAVAAGENVYFGVHPAATLPQRNLDHTRTRNDNIAAINCLYAEIDSETLPDFPFPPSAIIASGRGYHVYWLIDEPYLLRTSAQRAVAAYVQRAWTAIIGADPGASDLARTLRIPGALNWKYDPPRPVTWRVCNLDVRYALETLVAILPPPPRPRVHPARGAVSGASGLRPIDAYNQTRQIGAELERRGYVWRGRDRMLSPYSRSGQPGVYVDDATNRAFVHHSSDPLCDGYWKRPFDVLLRLDCNNDFARALMIARAELLEAS